MMTAGLMGTLKFSLRVPPAESVTFRVKATVPAAVGVLLKVTVLGMRLISGRARAVPPSLKAVTVMAVYGGVPLLTVTTWLYGTPTEAPGRAAGAVVSAGLMVMV